MSYDDVCGIWGQVSGADRPASVERSQHRDCLIGLCHPGFAFLVGESDLRGNSNHSQKALGFR
jgi:hypothetical protein